MSDQKIPFLITYEELKAAFKRVKEETRIPDYLRQISFIDLVDAINAVQEENKSKKANVLGEGKGIFWADLTEGTTFFRFQGKNYPMNTWNEKQHIIFDLFQNAHQSKRRIDTDYAVNSARHDRCINDFTNAFIKQLKKAGD